MPSQPVWQPVDSRDVVAKLFDLMEDEALTYEALLADLEETVIDFGRGRYREGWYDGNHAGYNSAYNGGFEPTLPLTGEVLDDC